MKVKELIDELKKFDGEDEVCVGNQDIHAVYGEPAYWDGRLQRLIKDASGHIVGAKYTARGTKIVIRPMSVHDALDNNPDMPVDYSEIGNEGSRADYKERDEAYRVWIKDIIQKIEDEIAAKKVANPV